MEKLQQRGLQQALGQNTDPHRPIKHRKRPVEFDERRVDHAKDGRSYTRLDVHGANTTDFSTDFSAVC